MSNTKLQVADAPNNAATFSFIYLVRPSGVIDVPSLSKMEWVARVELAGVMQMTHNFSV